MIQRNVNKRRCQIHEPIGHEWRDTQKYNIVEKIALFAVHLVLPVENTISQIFHDELAGHQKREEIAEGSTKSRTLFFLYKKLAIDLYPQQIILY